MGDRGESGGGRGVTGGRMGHLQARSCPGAHLRSASLLGGEDGCVCGASLAAQRGIDLFLKCKFGE